MGLDTNFLNYLGRQFTPPDNQELQQQASQNALLRNAVQQAPMRNQALQLQNEQEGLHNQAMRGQLANQGRTLAAQYYSAIARSDDPLAAAKMAMSDPDFASSSQAAGVPLHKDGIMPTDTAESIRQQATSAARMLGVDPFAKEQYTLKPGEVRYEGGKQIASGPPDSGNVEWVATGAQKVPKFAKTGGDVPGIKPIPMEQTPAQAVDPQSVENTAQMIASGQMPMLSGFSLKTPWGQQVVSRVKEIAPDYQGGAYNAKAAALRQFTSGTQGNTVRSLNVAISHLGTLGDLATALQNNDMQLANQAANTWKTQTGNPAPTNFSSARDIVANEVVKAITASGGSLADREEAQRQIQAAASPAQLHGVIDTWTKLLGGQLGGLQQQYEQGTGQKDFQRFLSPDTLSKLEPVAQPGATKSGAAPEGTVVSNGTQTLKKIGGRWVAQ